MASPLFFALPGNEDFAERLSAEVDGESGRLTLHAFPDGESYVRVETSPAGREVVLVATLQHPNEKILPLIFLTDTVRELGATSVRLVAPYLAYMRQDTRFHDGEAVTSRSFAALLSRAVDSLITVDPHLHRFTSLDQLYTIPSTVIHAAEELAAWIAANVASPLIIGPDAESRQWAERIARAADAPCLVLTKTRRGDADVVESIPDLGAHRSRTPVLVDDIISTGQTMIAAIQHLAAQGTAAPECVGVHAMFADGAYAALMAAGAARVVTTNTIAHPTNRIDVVPAISRVLRRNGAQHSNAQRDGDHDPRAEHRNDPE